MDEKRACQTAYSRGWEAGKATMSEWMTKLDNVTVPPLYRFVWDADNKMWLIYNARWERIDKMKLLATAIVRLALITDGKFTVEFHGDSLAGRQRRNRQRGVDRWKSGDRSGGSLPDSCRRKDWNC